MWTSVTFNGQRHHFTLRIATGAVPGQAAIERLEALFATAAIALAGHIVAELAIVSTAVVAGAHPAIVATVAVTTVEA